MFNGYASEVGYLYRGMNLAGTSDMREAAQALPFPGLDVGRRYRWIYKPAVFLKPGAAGLDGVQSIRLARLRPGGRRGEVPRARARRTALNFLMLTLVVTPVRLITGLTQLRPT